jgi:2-iminobutanoate/2-iminopropanoate deaminase
MNQAICTDQSPKAIGPYSQAVIAGGTLYISGQIPLDPATGLLVEGGIVPQTRQVMKNIGAILAEAMLTYKDIVKTTIFLVDLEEFSQVNETYASYLADQVLPARSTVQVAKLPRNSGVEIECIARR